MDSMCTRCAVRLLRQSHNAIRSSCPPHRSFSALSTRQAGLVDLSEEQPAEIRKVDADTHSPKISKYTQSKRPPSTPPQRANTANTDTTTTSRPPGQLLTRTRPSPTPTGQLIRRTRAPTRPGQPTSATRPRPRRGPNQPSTPRTTDAELASAYTEEDASTTESTITTYLNTYIDPPLTPQTSLPYTPGTTAGTSLSELQLDWPNTPVSRTGLTESVMQKVTFLANRLPHGYWTPMQLAERFERGQLVRFESEEEKEVVLRLAGEVAAKKAEKEMEEKGEEVEAKDMEFVSLESREEEARKVVSEMVRGEYQGVPNQSRVFKSHALRQLRNNETYGPVQMEKFMARINRLMEDVGLGAQRPVEKKQTE